MIDWTPFIITFKLAFITTILLFVISIPLAYWLAYSKFKVKFLFEAIFSLPIVLPPSVLGFYLLVAFSSQNPFGAFLSKYFDISIPFTFSGLVIVTMLAAMSFEPQLIWNDRKKYE